MECIWIRDGCDDMEIEKAYLFGKRISGGTPPAVMFQNGSFSTDFVSAYYRPSSAYSPEAPGVFGTVRPQIMAEGGADGYNGAMNLYALGSKYQNVYSISGGNIVRSCSTGTSTDQSGCSVFIPLNNLTTAYKKVSVEYKMENTQNFSYISVGLCKLSGTAYQSLILQGSTVANAWTTFAVQLSEATVLDALEIQTTYGDFEIRKIVFE